MCSLQMGEKNINIQLSSNEGMPEEKRESSCTVATEELDLGWKGQLVWAVKASGTNGVTKNIPT